MSTDEGEITTTEVTTTDQTVQVLHETDDDTEGK
jgi:hypothetical protein